MADNKKAMQEELAKLVRRRSEVLQTQRNIERQLYAMEGSYLENTQDSGNIIQGWSQTMENIDRRPNKNDIPVEQNRTVNDNDRIFSKSSSTSKAAVDGSSRKIKWFGGNRLMPSKHSGNDPENKEKEPRSDKTVPPKMAKFTTK